MRFKTLYGHLFLAKRDSSAPETVPLKSLKLFRNAINGIIILIIANYYRTVFRNYLLNYER